MRIFELSTRITAISRRDGRSATAAAAYRACCAIHCQREDRLHDYRRKRGREASRMIAPSGSPAWATDRAALWNAAELRERNGKRGPNAGQFKAGAKTAREFMFAFPVELSAAGRLAVAETVARHLVGIHGIVADFSLHHPGKDGDERNFHCHLLTTTRRMTAQGLGEKAREWDALSSGGKLSKAFRAFLARTMNEALAGEGQAGAVHVEHRSFKERGGTQRPQKHLGPGRTNALRRRMRQTRQAWQSAQGLGQRDRHAEERAALAARQQRAFQHKVRELADREQRMIAALRDAPRPEHAAGKPSALQRLAQLFGREARPAGGQHDGSVIGQPVEAKIAAVRAGIQAERDAYVAGQATERQALGDRQAAEDRQLATAAGHRVVQDRAVEQQARRAPGQELGDRQHSMPWEEGHSRQR